MSDFKKLDEVIKDRDVDIFYHLAWSGSSGELRGDFKTQFDNVKFSCESLEVCQRLGCRRFVFASSIMEYEIMAQMQTDAVPGKNTLYSSAKLSADFFIRTLAGNLGIDYVRAVISNVYGPGEKSPRLVNASLRKMLNREHCSFTNGKQMYDFIYVSDAAKAFFAIGNKGASGRTYYIGSLNPRPLKDFLNQMRNLAAPKMKLGIGEVPFHGISLTYDEFDIYAVKNDTGFCPLVSFEEGIKKTISWIKENENG